MAERLIELKNIRKTFDGEVALGKIDLYVRRREFLTLLGPSGCGKTTMLRIIAGFEQADSGDLLFEGKRINDVPPYQRRVNTVFQKYSLFPHMNVYDNVAFGLNIKKRDKKEIQKRVPEMLELVGLALKSAGRNRSPAASSSAWPSPVRWSTTPRCCFWMSRWPRWI